MLTKTTFLLTLFASAALAIPSSGERLQTRIARRLLSFPKISLASHPEFSSNWAGAVLSEAAGTFTNVSAIITVPKPTLPSGATGTHAASAWVGIDGDTCATSILQTGLDFTVDADGTVSYDAWYEWYPDFAYDFNGITFNAGDSVMFTVEAHTTQSGTATIINLTSGEQVTQNITSNTALCQQDAEWIVEDFEENNEPVPFANFGQVTFDNARAITTSQTSVGPSKADVIVIEQNGQTLTTGVVGTDNVTVTYKAT